MNFLFKKDRVYLDYASACPTSDRVKDAMKPFVSQWFFNPNGLYKRAVLVREKIDNFRESIADYFGVAAQEVIFTSGGTESDNLAILGVVSYIQHTHPDSIPHIIVSSIEHSAVLETVLFLEQTGSARVTYVPVSKAGVVDLEVLKKSLTPETVLVSVMMVNNEVGSVQPISDIVKSVRHFKKHTLGNPHALYPLVHTDASQAVLYQEVFVPRLGVDLLSCNGGKIYGPKGIGILVRKKHVPMISMMHGGGQEFGVRPGTQSVPLIAGIAEAFQETKEIQKEELVRLWGLYDNFISHLHSKLPQVVVNSSRGVCVPGVVNMSVPGIESDLLLLELDTRGFEVSSKSACKYDDPDESYVLRAMKGAGSHEEDGTLRVSIGRHTSKKDLERFVQALSEVVEKYGRFYSSLEKNSSM